VKKRGKKTEIGSLNWRPDFRDADALPDVKTVRTSFFVSALALSLAMMSLMHVGFHEYSIISAQAKVEAVNGSSRFSVETLWPGVKRLVYE
jgi:hypothetical protein